MQRITLSDTDSQLVHEAIEHAGIEVSDSAMSSLMREAVILYCDIENRTELLNEPRRISQ